MKIAVRAAASLAVTSAALALVAFLFARTMDTTITTSDQNLVDAWASLLLAAAIVAASPILVILAVRRDRAAPRVDG